MSTLACVDREARPVVDGVPAEDVVREAGTDEHLTIEAQTLGLGLLTDLHHERLLTLSKLGKRRRTRARAEMDLIITELTHIVEHHTSVVTARGES